MKPKTGKERAAAHAARMRDQGHIKVSVSEWVPEDKADNVREAMKRAAKQQLNRRQK